jgi:hypothetical protein
LIIKTLLLIRTSNYFLYIDMSNVEEELRHEIKKLTSQLQKAQITAEQAQITAEQAQNELEYYRKDSLAQYFSGNRKFPCLRQDGSRTSASISKGHQVVDFEQHTFGMLEISTEQIKNLEKKISKILMLDDDVGYSTEMDICNLVHDVFIDMLNIANLGSELKLRCDLEIASLRADIWVICCNGYPVGAVEIKKPRKDKSSPTTFNRPKVQGQLFDYMLRIRSFHGLRHVFGIMTDFEDWRICWLPDSNDAALATQLSYSLHEDTIDVGCADTRMLYGSEIYSGRTETTTPILARALVSVLRKMDYGKNSLDVRKMQLLSDQRSYILLDSQSWFWTSLSSTELKKIRTNMRFSLVPPLSRCNKFILLRDYHGGADGRVWLAASVSSGNLAVIKFHRRIKDGDAGQDRAVIKQEVEVWKACGISSVFACTLNSRRAIVMPFSFHCRLDESGIPVFIASPDCWSDAASEAACTSVIEYLEDCQNALLDLDPCNVLRDCVTRMANAGYVHEDIEWRHVSVTPMFTRKISTRLRLQFDKFVCTFIDNGRVSKERNQATAAARMKPRVDELISALSI